MEPAEAALTISGAALMPPSPVHLVARPDGGGGWTIGWTRRSRNGWRWSSGTDAPLGEESELYAVRLLDGDALVRGAETAAAQWTYAAAMIAADGTAGRALTVEVAQRGTFAPGRVARIMLTA